MLHYMAAVPQMARQEEEEEQSSEYLPLKVTVSSVQDDTKPLLPVTPIPRHHYAVCMLNITIFMRWMERFACLWGTYGGIRERNMVGPCRGGGVQYTTMFQTVIGMIYSTVSMEYYKTRFSEGMEHGYTILPGFADTSHRDLFRDVNLPFDIDHDAELEGGIQLAFFQSVIQKFTRKTYLEAACSEELDWKIILIMP